MVNTLDKSTMKSGEKENKMTKKEFMEKLEALVVRKYMDIKPHRSDICPIAQLGRETGYPLKVNMGTIEDGTIQRVLELRVGKNFIWGIVEGFDGSTRVSTDTKAYAFGRSLRELYETKQSFGDFLKRRKLEV